MDGRDCYRGGNLRVKKKALKMILFRLDLDVSNKRAHLSSAIYSSMCNKCKPKQTGGRNDPLAFTNMHQQRVRCTITASLSHAVHNIGGGVVKLHFIAARRDKQTSLINKPYG
jgi:hypothetical protein